MSAAVCPACGAPLKEGQRFCKACGKPVAAAGPAPAPRLSREGRIAQEPPDPNQVTPGELPPPPVKSAYTGTGSNPSQAAAEGPLPNWDIPPPPPPGRASWMSNRALPQILAGLMVILLVGFFSKLMVKFMKNQIQPALEKRARDVCFEAAREKAYRHYFGQTGIAPEVLPGPDAAAPSYDEEHKEYLIRGSLMLKTFEKPWGQKQAPLKETRFRLLFQCKAASEPGAQDGVTWTVKGVSFEAPQAR